MPSPKRWRFKLHPPTFSVPLLQAKGKPGMSQLSDSRNQRERIDARRIFAPARNHIPWKAISGCPAPGRLEPWPQRLWLNRKHSTMHIGLHRRPPARARTIRSRMVGNSLANAFQHAYEWTTDEGNRFDCNREFLATRGRGL